MDRIIELIRKADIAEYRVVEQVVRSAELFFVKKQLDTRRIKDVKKTEVTVFRTEEKDGKKLKAAASAILTDSMSDEEIVKALTDAYYAAQFAMNPYYDAPKPEQSPRIEKTGRIAELDPEVSCGIMAKALFDADCAEGAFVNSAEVFVTKRRITIVSSEGTNVSWTDAKVSGEYVVQAREPEDVEMYKSFGFEELETAALTAQVSEALTFVRDRAHARSILKSGKYDVILTGENAAEVLNYFAVRSSAFMIYPGYSTWKPGDDVQGEVAGEKVSITLRAEAPFSEEGVPMRDRLLIDEGKLLIAHGGCRFAYYLGVPPTGDYRKISCDNKGSMSFDEMKKRPCLWAVTFSDFQMDPFSGHFGGEIRLAYLIDGEKAIPVTGGSINGSIMEAQKDIAFSTERFTGEKYSGPYAMLLRGVAVAGPGEE